MDVGLFETEAFSGSDLEVFIDETELDSLQKGGAFSWYVRQLGSDAKGHLTMIAGSETRYDGNANSLHVSKDFLRDLRHYGQAGFSQNGDRVRITYKEKMPGHSAFLREQLLQFTD